MMAKKMINKGLKRIDKSFKIFSSLFFTGSEMTSFENRKIVIADKTVIDKNPNFQNSENWLEISHPKPIFTTKIPIMKEASTLFMVFANAFSSEILFLIIPKTQIFPMAKHVPMIANHNL